MVIARNFKSNDELLLHGHIAEVTVENCCEIVNSFATFKGHVDKNVRDGNVAQNANFLLHDRFGTSSHVLERRVTVKQVRTNLANDNLLPPLIANGLI